MRFRKLDRLSMVLGLTLAILLGGGVSSAEEPICSAKIADIPELIGPNAAHKLGITIPELRKLKEFVPPNKFARLVLRLSGAQYLLLYENDNRDRVEDEADAHILLIHDGHLDSDFAMKSLAHKSADSLEWMESLHGVEYANACRDASQFIYLAFGTGMQGTFFVAIARRETTATIVPLGEAAQGHLLISASAPNLAELWSVTPRDGTLCTGCPKHYVVTTIDLSDGSRSVRAETVSYTHLTLPTTPYV